jgi:hypothetical protein
MQTDDLIAALAADGHPAPRMAPVLWAGLPVALALAAGLVGLVLGYRPDLSQALGNPLSLGRFAFGAGVGLAALALALVLARPAQPTGAQRAALVAVVVAALILYAVTWIWPPEVGRSMAFFGKTIVTCLTSIPILSVPVTGVVLWALRSGAPTRPGLTGFAAGLAGGGLAACTYALHCIEDSPLFYVTWYGLAILIAGGIGAALGSRALRW